MTSRLRSGLLFKPVARCAMGLMSSLLLVAAFLGCGGDEAKNTTAPAPERDLPALGEYMVPLHDGRIQVAPPKGWEIGSKKTGYVIWFKKSSKSSYPCVLVSAEDYDQTATVTGSNVKKFAAEIRDRLEEEGKLAKGVSPLSIDSFHGVSYRRLGKTKQKFKVLVLERAIVQTAVDGQLYTFELRAPEDAFEGVKDAVFAVAAGAKFPKSQTKPASTAKSSDEKPASEPTAKEPAKKPDAVDTEDGKPKATPQKTAEKKPPEKKQAVKKAESPKKPAKKKSDDESEFELLDEEL